MTYVLLAGCSAPATTPPPAPPAAVEVAPADDAAPPPPAAPWADRVGELPGWIGFATVPEGVETSEWYSPRHPNAQVVVFASQWPAPAGTAYSAIGSDATVRARYVDTAEHPYGCDANATAMAAFAADTAVAEGIVWLVPVDGDVAPRAEPIDAVEVSPERRRWTIGAWSVELERVADAKAQLRIARGDRVVRDSPHDKSYMDGADESPIDLSSGWEIGMPYPVAAYRFGDDATLIVFRQPGYEGNCFTTVVAEGRRVVDVTGDRHSPCLYYCAF